MCIWTLVILFCAQNTKLDLSLSDWSPAVIKAAGGLQFAECPQCWMTGVTFHSSVLALLIWVKSCVLHQGRGSSNRTAFLEPCFVIWSWHHRAFWVATRKSPTAEGIGIWWWWWGNIYVLLRNCSGCKVREKNCKVVRKDIVGFNDPNVAL